MKKKTNTKVRLKVLYLEDSLQDVEIVRELLIHEGFELEMDSTAAEKEFVSNLRHSTYDIILSDFKLPGFDAFGALKCVSDICPDVPFICLSGTVGEETAVELLKQGAVDYLLKENIKKLSSVIMRAIDEAKEKKALKEAEKQLREREESYRSLLESVTDAIITANKHGNIVTWNSGAEKMFGYSYVEAVGRPVIFIMPEHSRAGHIAGITRLQSGGAPSILGKTIEIEGLRNDGSLFPIELSLSTWKTLDGEFYTGIIHDITERKRLEEVITYERSLLRSLMENTPDHIYFKDIKSRFIRISAAQAHRFGINDPVLAMGKNDFDFFKEEHASKAYEDEKTIMQTGRSLINLEEHEVTSEGNESWVSTTKVPLRDHNGIIIGTFGISRDITDKKKAEAVLSEKEYILSQSQKLAHIGSWGWDLKGPLKWSDESYRVYGITPESITLTPESLVNLVHPEDRPLMVQWLEDCVAGKSPDDLEFRTILPDGSVRYIRGSGDLIHDDKGGATYMAGTVQDITKRKLAEQELIRLQLGIERSNDAIFVTDTLGVIQYINPAFTQIYGYTSYEAVGKTPRILKSEKFTPNNYKQFWDTLLSKEPVIGEMFNKVKDGRLICVEVSNNPILDKENNIIGFMGIHRDITFRKQAEEKAKTLETQLQQAQKLESLGTLASGIAHDFNNILGIIIGHSSLLQMVKESPEKQSQSIEAIMRASQRGAGLVKQLLTFARKTETVFDTVNINDTVKEINKLLIETIHKTIVITTSLQQDLPAIIGDSTQIHQVFLNLCVNARDAMPKGGTLSISTTAVHAESIMLPSVKIIARRYVKIEVKDTGMGMDEATLKRIFEPFFTTKGIGKGTGLGLSVVFGIVEHHNGFIDVRSVPGEGTCFILYLPIPERALHEMQPVGKDFNEIPGGAETILLIEDEEMLMELLKASLVSKGYTVLTADDGMRAVEMYQKYNDQIALVISDMGLPSLDGREVFRKIREINPLIKIIAASGYIDPEMKSEMFKAGMKNFIQKPYLLDEVLQKIRDAIDTKDL